MIEQTFRYRCDFCGTSWSPGPEPLYRPYSVPVLPVPPAGWRVLDGQLICPGHAIEVRASSAGGTA